MATDEQVAAPVHDVHTIASEAATIEANVEKFLDEALITSFQSTPLHTIEDVLEERRERSERQERLKNRAKELLQEELETQRHTQELRELEQAIDASKQTDGAHDASKRRQHERPAADGEMEGDEALTEAVASAPFKLQGVGRSRNIKPYVANTSDFATEGECNRQISELRAESEMLRKCLSERSNPKAFEQYLRAARNAPL